MPLIHLHFDNDRRPIIRAFVGVSGPRRQALASAGQPVPTPVLLSFLIDTGASSTATDPGAVQTLGLIPTGSALINTPSTGGVAVSCNLYDASLIIPASVVVPPFIVEATPILETPGLRSQGIDGLLGRDVLSKCVLIYNGQLSSFTLAY